MLALQGDVREHHQALSLAGATSSDVRRPEHLAGLDGLVLPGGESTTMSRLLNVFELLEPLRAKVAAGLPVYGSCAGMILLAREILDGRPDQTGLAALDVTVRRNAFGRQVESFETDLAFAGVGQVHAVFIRAPWVERVGDGVEVLGRVPTSAGAQGPAGTPAAGKVVAVRQGALLATSFHPELTGDTRVHALFVQMVKGSRPW